MIALCFDFAICFATFVNYEESTVIMFYWRLHSHDTGQYIMDWCPWCFLTSMCFSASIIPKCVTVISMCITCATFNFLLLCLCFVFLEKGLFPESNFMDCLLFETVICCLQSVPVTGVRGKMERKRKKEKRVRERKIHRERG